MITGFKVYKPLNSGTMFAIRNDLIDCEKPKFVYCEGGTLIIRINWSAPGDETDFVFQMVFKQIKFNYSSQPKSDKNDLPGQNELS